MKQTELFSDWILAQLNKRGWTQGELSRRANVSSGTLSMVINYQRGAGPDFCRSIAKAFGVPEEEVFRQAGLLSPIDNPSDHSLRQIYEAVQLLTVEQRETILKMILGLQK